MNYNAACFFCRYDYPQIYQIICILLWFCFASWGCASSYSMYLWMIAHCANNQTNKQANKQTNKQIDKHDTKSVSSYVFCVRDFDASNARWLRSTTVCYICIHTYIFIYAYVSMYVHVLYLHCTERPTRLFLVGNGILMLKLTEVDVRQCLFWGGHLNLYGCVHTFTCATSAFA